MLKRVSLLCILWLWLCPISHAAPLTVAVAANLKYVFDDLADAFKQETGVEIQSVFNASGKLATQIRQGAPFDVLLSADMAFAEGLYQDGFAASPPHVYAYGVLVLWTQTGVDLRQGMAGLTAAHIKKIAIANPKVAPFGVQALNAMAFYQCKEALLPKLVYGESIAQVSQYVDTKVVDVGITAKSIVLAAEMAGKGQWVALPEESYTPIAQGMVVLTHGRQHHPEAAQQFERFVLSARARAIFSRYGYQLPPPRVP